MKHAKWLVLSHALCLALGGLVCWLLIARPRSAADAATIAGLRAGANNVEKQLADHLVIDRLVDDSFNETRNQLQAVTDALGRAIAESNYWRANYNETRKGVDSLTELVTSGASGVEASEGTARELQDTLLDTADLVRQLPEELRGGGPAP